MILNRKRPIEPSAVRHRCHEAPRVRVVFSIARCVRCGWLVDFTTDEVLASTEEEINAARIGLAAPPVGGVAG